MSLASKYIVELGNERKEEAISRQTVRKEEDAQSRQVIRNKGKIIIIKILIPGTNKYQQEGECPQTRANPRST